MMQDGSQSNVPSFLCCLSDKHSSFLDRLPPASVLMASQTSSPHTHVATTSHTVPQTRHLALHNDLLRPLPAHRPDTRCLHTHTQTTSLCPLSITTQHARQNTHPDFCCCRRWPLCPHHQRRPGASVATQNEICISLTATDRGSPSQKGQGHGD